jgi:uncharacterized protein
MMLLALALNLDPVYVGAHHLVRIFFVSLSMPFIARYAGPAKSRKKKSKAKQEPPIARPPFEDFED